MSIVLNFSEIKCDKCNKDGFITTENGAIKCNCRQHFEQELKTSDVLSRSGLLNENSTYEDFKKLIDFDWSNYRGKDENGNLKKLQKFVDEFDSDKKPFKHLHCYVWGKQGTQKSYTMKGVLTKLAIKGKSVYYIFAKDLINLIIDSDRDETAKKKLDYIMNVDCLALDEFDTQRIASWKSNYKENILLVPLKNRMEVTRKSTWIISNLSIDEQKETSFGELYYDLLKRETCYGQFFFNEKYFDNLSKEDIEKTMQSIWND